MAQYDGSIRINTEINSKNASAQLMTLENRIVKTADKIAALRAKMDALKDVKTPTQEYSKLKSALEEQISKLQELNEYRQKFYEKGLLNENQLKVVDENIKLLEETIKRISGEMYKLDSAGQAFTFGSDTQEYANLRQQLRYAENDLSILTGRHEELSAKQNDNSERYKQLSSAAKTAFNSIGKALEKANSLIDSFGKRIKQAFLNFSILSGTSNKSAITTSRILKSILRYGLGIRSLYVLVNKIRTGIKEGFSNFMDYSSKFKSSIDSIKSSALTLKNAFAAAFSPLVEIAIPYIQRVIDYLVKLLDVVGQVIAAITGQKTYTKAIKQTTAAIEDQNKAQNKQVSNLDKLNNLTSGSSGGGADGSIGDMFEEAPIEDKWQKMADKIKEIGKSLFAPLKAAWDKEGKFVMDSWKYALDEIKKLVKDIGRDFLTVWNQPETIAMFEDIFHIVGDIGLVVGNLAKNFREAWNTNQVGLHIFENIRDILAVIIHNIRLAADYTVEWSKTLDFYPLLSKIEEWTRSLVPVFDALSGILMDFYTMVLLPLAKWTLEKGLPELLQVFIDFNNKVDWEALRSNLAEFWKHLEPFAETVGEGLILFIRDVSDALAGFLNSQQFKDFLKTVSDWMDKVTPRDVADGLEKLAKAVISIKLALLGFKAITSVAKGLTMAKAFFAIWKGGSGAAMASEMTAAAGGIGGLSGALSAFAGNAALAASAAGIAATAFEPFKKLTTDFDNNAEARFYEEYKGISGTLKLIKDNFKDFTNDISTFENAMETVNEGIILTDEQMRKLSQSTGFCDDDIESLTEGMIYLHPELAEIREEFGLWGAYPETLSNIAQGVGLIKDGTVDAGKAFDEFRKPMWNMTEDALAFFSQIQEGTVSVTDAHGSMKEQVVMNNGEITASNDALEIDLSDHTAEWTTDMQIITDEHGNMVLDVTQGSDNLRDTFDSNNADINTSNDGMAQNFSDNADNITEKVSDIEGSLNENRSGFSLWAESIMGSLKSVWESARLWLGKAIDKIGELMSAIGGAVGSAFSGGGSVASAVAFSSPRAFRSLSQMASPYSAMPQMAALSKMEFPGYATGQVIPASMKKHLAWLGDNNHETEVVSPLSTMKQANKEAILEVLSELGIAGGNGRSTDRGTYVFQVDGKTFFEITRDEARKYFSRTGRSPYPT
ncbi:MAG: hypothetical protein K2I96_17430 [Lachnospiraceae bacterium]|nr:hypothetical protein [Lachnospiraceae bacterium]